MADNKKTEGFLSKILKAGEAILDEQIHKAKAAIQTQNMLDHDSFEFSKAITEDPTYAIHASGWKEKPGRLTNAHFKQISYKDSVISAIIQTRQNQVSNQSKRSKSDVERGWTVELRDKDRILDEIKEELKAKKNLKKLEEKASLEEGSSVTSDDQDEKYDWELERKAKAELEKRYKEERAKVIDFIEHCGDPEAKPLSARKWNFDAALRAWVRDSLTYDLYATEIVHSKIGNPVYWFPVDGSTIKYASSSLSNYADSANTLHDLDILYPEKEAEAREESKVLDIDPEKLQNGDYFWVQVIRGKVERAYTSDELKVGIRNLNTDIYNNGYGISELELAVSLVTGHLNAEFYNQAYFTQGFSAKGILHIKSQIDRRKMETLRQQWQHMLKGSRNSFQTPIFAGVDAVEWIPLTQNHNDIGFENWLRYLIKMTCAIYQIDPAEIGINLKDEGSKAGLSGDNTQEKLNQSRDKGLYPLLRHIENYINTQILQAYNPKWVIKFTGMTGESKEEFLKRLEAESKTAKTVNEVREEMGLPPLPGMDGVILNPTFMQWYTTFSDDAKAKEKAAQDQSFNNSLMQGFGNDQEDFGKSFKTLDTVKIEYYKIKE